MNSRVLLVLVAMAAVVGGWKHHQRRAYDQLPGILVSEEPRQQAMDAGEKTFKSGDFTVDAQASYHVRARILSLATYSRGAESDLSPLDLTLGWGPMSDTAILEQMSIETSSRFYSWRTPGPPPIPGDVINRHAANTHIIPANGAVLDSLNTMRPGQVVELDGYLVNVHRADGWHWNSSLTREDSGAGACELMWVESARII